MKKRKEKRKRSPRNYLSRNIRSTCFAMRAAVGDLGINISVGDLSSPQQRTCNSPTLGNHNTIICSSSFIQVCLYGYYLLLLSPSMILSFSLCFVFQCLKRYDLIVSVFFVPLQFEAKLWRCSEMVVFARMQVLWPVCYIRTTCGEDLVSPHLLQRGNWVCWALSYFLNFQGKGGQMLRFPLNLCQ